MCFNNNHECYWCCNDCITCARKWHWLLLAEVNGKICTRVVTPVLISMLKSADLERKISSSFLVFLGGNLLSSSALVEDRSRYWQLTMIGEKAHRMIIDFYRRSFSVRDHSNQGSSWCCCPFDFDFPRQQQTLLDIVRTTLCVLIATISVIYSRSWCFCF